MKLKVYQQGGGLIYTPFIPEQYAVSGSSSSKRSNSSDEDSKIDPLDKELIGLMKGQNLLSSDIEVIYDRLIRFQKSTQNLSDPLGLGTGSSDYRSVMPGMLQIMRLVETAKNNKAEWDEKVSEIKKHDAGAEVAMDSYGRMWVQDPEKGLTRVTPSEFDRDTQTPVSNSQLIALRRRSPELAFSDAVLGDTGIDVVGAEDVRKEIDEIIKAAGSIKEVKFGKIPFSEIAEDLQGAGIYKVSQKYSKADLKGFAELLYSQLSNSAKHLITANAAIGGYDKLDYINSIINSRTPVEPDIDYQASITKATGTGGTGGSGADGDEKNLTEDSYIEGLARGSNHMAPRETMFNPTSKISLHAFVQNAGELKENDGKTKVNPGMLDAVFEKVGLKDISPQMTVTFGDQIIDESNLGQVLYDGSPVQRVDLPYTTINGEVTVDWGLIETIEEANKQLESKAVTPGMLKELASNNPKLVWNENTGKLEARNHMWFITFGAMVGDDFVEGLDLTTNYLEKMSDDRKKTWEEKYVEAIEYGFVNHGKNDPKRTAHHKTKWGFPIKFNYNSNFYHGNVFMPILNELAGVTEYSSKNSRTHNMQSQAAAARELEIQQQAQAGERSFNW